MIVKFNPSGTHIHKGFLKVRLDLYPEVGDKTYALHYVDQFDREPTEDELADEAKLALIPKHKGLNPCLSHFITIDPDISLQVLIQWIKYAFDVATVQQLDLLLSKSVPDFPKLRQAIKGKFGSGKRLLVPIDESKLNALNSRLSSLEVKL